MLRASFFVFFEHFRHVKRFTFLLFNAMKNDCAHPKLCPATLDFLLKYFIKCRIKQSVRSFNLSIRNESHSSKLAKLTGI